MRGKEGRRRWFGLAVAGISAGKVPGPRRISLEPGDSSTKFVIQERRFPARVAKIFFGSGFFVGGRGIDLLGVVEDQDATVVEQDLLGLPGGTLVEGLGLCAGGVPFLVKPVQVWIVVGDPFLDGLPNNT